MADTMNALVFPGQGSQHVGMTERICALSKEAAMLQKQADEILGFSISEIVANGPEDKLKNTEYAQPAIFLTSAMYFELIKEREIPFSAVAGHSLGEYSALYTAGCFSFEVGLQLVHQRGKLMANAPEPGEMHAVLGLEREMIQAVLDLGDYNCSIANHNTKTQIVLSGEGKHIQRCISQLRTAYGPDFKVIQLNVSGPFHSALMKEPQKHMESIIQSIDFQTPGIPVLPNVNPTPTIDIDTIRASLVRQMTGTVNWVDTVMQLKQMGMELIYEVGAGDVLQKLNKAIVFRPKCVGLLD